MTLPYTRKSGWLYSAICWVWAFIASIATGFRPVGVGSDTEGYIAFLNVATGKSWEELSQQRFEPGFKLLVWVLTNLWRDHQVTLTAIALVFFSLLVVAIRRHFHDKLAATFVIAIYFSFFTTYYYSVNTIRQGLAMGLSLISFHYLAKRRWGFAILFAAMAPFFHGSALIILSVVLVVALATLRRPPLRIFVTFWLASIVMSILKLNDFFMSTLLKMAGVTKQVEFYTNDARLLHYSLNGFRLDFALFSAAPLVLFIRKSPDTDEDRTLLITYLALNSVYFMLNFLAYQDRIASYSWFMIPIIIGKAFLRYKWDNKAMRAVLIVIPFVAAFLLPSPFRLIVLRY